MDLITIQQLTQNDIRKAIRAELEEFFVENKINSVQSDADEIGGIDLAMSLTGLAKPTIYSLCSRRRLPHSKRGKRLYFSRKDLTDWLKAGRRKTQNEIAAEVQTINSQN